MEKSSSLLRNDYPILLGILILALFLRLKYFVGIYRFDSFFYSQLSYFISQGDLNSFFNESGGYFAAGRIILFIPTGLLYKFFGVNDLTSVAFVIMCSLLSVAVIFLLGKKLVDKKMGLLSSFLLAIYPLDVVYATQYLPDGVIVTLLAFASLFFLYGESEKIYKRKILFYFLSGTFVGLAQFVRENAFIFLGVLLIYIIIKRQYRFIYGLVLVGFSAVFILVGLFFVYGAGDFFFQINRLAATLSSTTEEIFNFFHADWLGFTRIFMVNEMFKPFVLLIIFSIMFSLGYLRNKMKFPLIWFFSFSFYLEILSQIHGLEKTDRYLSILTVPLILLVASTLVFIQSRFKIRKIAILIFLTIVTFSSAGSISKASSIFSSNRVFNTYRSIASFIRNKPLKKIYITNLKQKGYIFNYVFDFKSLNYNSFQRGDVSGTESLLQNWDGISNPEPDSYVVIDSTQLNSKVKPDWELIYKKNNAILYNLPVKDSR